MQVATEPMYKHPVLVDMDDLDILRVRRNTVRCDFSHLRRDLCVLEMHDFVDNYLRLPPEQLDRLQWNGRERCLFLRLKDLHSAQLLVEQHNGRHRYPPGRLWTRIHLTLEDITTEVLLYDLSELVSDEDIRDVLNRYGVVVSLQHNMWRRGLRYGGINSGHRLVNMVIRQPIPRTIWIGNEAAFVAYVGQDGGRKNPDLDPVERMLGRVLRFLRRVFLPCLGPIERDDK